MTWAMTLGRLATSAREFHAIRAYTRPEGPEFFNTIHHACRLAQQYWIDAYATIEQDRLRWLGATNRRGGSC
ncbi:hypothetical protein N7535_001887 [Penicillium sp. DV-2018c]|nr:hypothetical protein N7461_004872 [Penicillium sp. DV-2018c]KAJ5583267.1 hypothetical protein N7535_001887 [Penicillium sp. DV-2018c]